MLRKHLILLGILISLSLLFVATLHYPGGSQFDLNSVGYSWKHNYQSNLFNEIAMNGSANGSRPWAIVGMLFLSLSFGLFFIDFSKKIPSKGAAKVIRYCGIAAMIFAALTVTPYHDDMITLASVLALVSIFYITVFIFKSQLHLLKVLSVLCLLVLYCANYVYYTGNYLEYLPLLQKIALTITVIWILCLQYLTTHTHFQEEILNF